MTTTKGTSSTTPRRRRLDPGVLGQRTRRAAAPAVRDRPPLAAERAGPA
ncbi:hypothetical protein ACW23B_08745 [Streptomyces albidoflavus]